MTARNITHNLGKSIFSIMYDDPGYSHLEEEFGMEKNATYVIDTGEFDVARSEFIAKTTFDCVGIYTSITSENISLDDVMEVVRSVDGNVRFVFNEVQSSRSYVFGHVYKNDLPIAILQIYADTNQPFYEKGLLRGHVVAFGEKEYVRAVSCVIKEKIGEKKLPTAKWHYISDGTHHYAEMSVTSSAQLHNEYYPFIEGGIENFIDEYLASTSSILILLGPPGTGKSTLLRHMIVSRNLTVTLTYEERLLQQDKLFIQHLSEDGNSDILILEDADVLLESRETSGNHVMNKLLNVSDGIIKIMNKKIVFTANLPSVKNIDEALLRAGRCYNVIEFRELNFEEAVAAAKVGNLTVPTDTHKTYSLANLFQNKGGSVDTGRFVKTRRVGFGMR